MLSRLAPDRRSQILKAVEVWPSLSEAEQQEFWDAMDTQEILCAAMEHQAYIRSIRSVS